MIDCSNVTYGIDNLLAFYVDINIIDGDTTTNFLTATDLLTTLEYESQNNTETTVISNDNFSVVQSLPEATLDLFETAVYSIDDSAEYVCVSYIVPPETDEDVFWLER
jgi:hypothetical protein